MKWLEKNNTRFDMKKPFGIKSKFILVVTLLLLSIFIADSVLYIRSNIAETEKQLTAEATAFAELSTRPLAESYDLYFESGYLKFSELFSKITSLDKNITKIQFIDMNGKVILDSSNVQRDHYIETANTIVGESTIEKVRSSEPIITKIPDNEKRITDIVYPYFSDWGGHAYSIRYFVSYDEVRQNVINIVVRSVILMLIFLILSVALITGSINKLILTPISNVNLATQKISQGKYDERIEINSSDEIGQLANATNKMAATLKQNIDQLKELDKLKDEFIDIAAHNLKIPLTHLKANTDYLLKTMVKKIDGKSYAIIKDIEINSNKLNLLSEDLINITSLRQDTMQSGIFMPVDLVGLINNVIFENGGIISNKKIIVNKDFIPQAEILADKQKLKQVFSNILDNAVKFSEAESIIDIRIKQFEKSYVVEFKDHGIGMTEEERSRVFQKFFRAPSSAAYNKEGTGLGLYVDKMIVEIHRGKITVESKINVGTKFTVTLPQKEAFKTI